MTPLVYTKIEPKRRSNVFVVTFSFEHGDADKKTTDDINVHLSKDDFVHYLAKVKEVSTQINDARSNGQRMPANFEKFAYYNGVPILVELDCFASNFMSNFYASMDVENIVYFDAVGDKFNVT